MSLEKITQVCRLCRASSEYNNLVDIFQENFSYDVMCMVISDTTGVEIKQDDLVSRKLCSNCFNCTTIMYRYRRTSVENDKFLKDKFAHLLETLGPQILDETEKNESHSELERRDNTTITINSNSDGAPSLPLTRNPQRLFDSRSDDGQVEHDISTAAATSTNSAVNVSVPLSSTTSREGRDRFGTFKKIRKWFSKRK